MSRRPLEPHEWRDGAGHQSQKRQRRPGSLHTLVGFAEAPGTGAKIVKDLHSGVQITTESGAPCRLGEYLYMLAIVLRLRCYLK